MSLKAKTYHFYNEKYLYGRKRYFLVGKLKIKCIGGESMNEKEELVFIEPNDIPRSFKKTGRNWNSLFDKIPKDKVLVFDTETYGSVANIRQQAKNYSESHNNNLKIVQRTNKKTQETKAYVHKVK